MADPLSVAGSAVGIVSLGLSVCQGLISYYGPLRAYDQEIGELAQKAEGLKSTLRIVQVTLQNFEPTWKLQANDVQSNINSCREVLHKLEKAIEKYGKTEPPPDFAVRLQGTGKRALYPFKRKTLIWLRTSVEGVQMNLNTTLQVLQLALIAHQKEQTEHLISMSITTTAVTNKVYERIHQLDARSSTIYTMMATLQNETSRTISGIAGSKQHLQDINPTITKLQQKLISEPTLLRTLCGEQSQVNRDSQEQLRHLASRSRRYRSESQGSCSCCIQSCSTKTYYQISRVSFFQFTNTSHSDDCPLGKTPGKKRIFEIKYAVCGFLLRFSVQATLSIICGAGSLSIGPQLALRNIVPDNAPSFKLLDALVQTLQQINRPVCGKLVSDSLDSTLKQLHILFDTGAASPTDTTLSGQTLLHYACHIFRVIVFAQIDAVQSYKQFLKEIIDAGANINDIGEDGRTPLDYLIYYIARYVEQSENYAKVAANICSHLVDAGAVVSKNAMDHPGKSINSLKIIEIVGRHDDEYNTVFDMNEIAAAIFKRSERLLNIAISKHPASINTRISNKTPLYLSAGWPYGVLLLLKAGAGVNVESAYSQLPIHHACLLGCLPSVLLLIDAGSALFTHSSCTSDDVLDCAIQSGKPEIIQTVIFTLAQRRQQLQKLAEATLPAYALSKLNMQHDRLLDSGAFDVWQILRNYSRHVDESLNPGYHSSSVYHTRSLDLGTATELFENGFHDVNSLDWAGGTPLMQLGKGFNYARRGLNESLALGCWLISKGADIHQEVEEVSVSCSIGHDLGDYFREGLWDLQYHQVLSSEIVRSISHGLFSGLDIQSWGLLQEILDTTKVDACFCACSPHGCRPLTKLLKTFGKGVIILSQISTEISEKDLRLSFLQGFIECLVPHLKDSSTIPTEVIRFLTFTELELTHICCYLTYCHEEDLPPEEVKEIYAEQRSTIDELEELVSQFETQYSELGKPLHIFLQDYWSPKMDEHLAQDSILDEEIFNGARKLGVILELY